MSRELYSALAIVIMAVITALLRCLPFFVFSGKRASSPFVTYLGTYLPYAMMGMLVVYCFKSVTFTAAPFGAPELIASLVVVLLHVWKRNSLLSIGLGTGVYMLLVQFVF